MELALESDSRRAILEALAASADSVSGLAERVDRDPSTVSHHLAGLESDNLIKRERGGQSVTNRLTPGARAVVAREAGDATAADGPTAGD